MIEKEDPDLICLMEVRKNQIKHLMNKKYLFNNFNVKYSPKKPIRKIPRFDVQGNGFISKKELNMQNTQN